MEAVGKLLPPSAPPLLLKKPTNFFSLLFQHQTANLPLFPESLPNYSSLSLSSSFSGRTGFCLFAQNKEKNPNLDATQLVENDGEIEDEDGFDFDEDDVFDDEEEEEDEFDDDDELMVTYDKMNEWLENRPRGFGEGKVYDTSVEDKLLEEIEQSFKAQLSNITKLKNEGKKPKPKNDPPEVLFNASEGVPGGIRVRISNLPKKRNIHRDLKSAFEGVSGIIKISPVNSGNKKTRDPVCKGLAYVDFKSLADANRFIQMFSGQNISFGKSEKPIKCEILKPLDGSYEGSSDDGYNSTSEGNFLASEEEEDEDVDVEQIETALQFREDDDYVYEELVKSIKALDSQNVLGDLLQLSASERLKQVEMLEAKLLARASLNEVKSPKKKSEVKKKPDKKPNQKSDKDPNLKLEKKPKQRIPGSAKKLKVKEKAKLADVFARYGTRGASASKEK
ncbi:uncharacterized protein LOC110714729 [Chenopodium quinoa]|nr:uncharacterized protein LOC110714729 [Chenopodium quinoa]